MSLECPDSIYHTPMYISGGYVIIITIILAIIIYKHKNKLFDMKYSSKRSMNNSQILKQSSKEEVLPQSAKSSLSLNYSGLGESKFSTNTLEKPKEVPINSKMEYGSKIDNEIQVKV